jgi:hypothetical protein
MLTKVNKGNSDFQIITDNTAKYLFYYYKSQWLSTLH